MPVTHPRPVRAACPRSTRRRGSRTIPQWRLQRIGTAAPVQRGTPCALRRELVESDYERHYECRFWILYRLHAILLVRFLEDPVDAGEPVVVPPLVRALERKSALLSAADPV